MDFIHSKIKPITELCLKHKVKNLFAFGSVIREDFNTKSDVDLLVDFNENDPIQYSNLYFEFKERLETLLKRKIDLLEERAIKNPYFKQELEQTKVKIYGS